MIHCAMTVPCAVEPEDRRLPVAQVKPAPAKVAAVPPVAEVMAEVEAPEVIAPPEVIGPPDVMGEPDVMAEADVIGALEAIEPLEAGAEAALEAAALAELLLAAAVVLLLLPQAAMVSAPATTRASKPVLRVIFTPFPPQVVECSAISRPGIHLLDPAGRGTPLRRCIPDVMGIGWTPGPPEVNG